MPRITNKKTKVSFTHPTKVEEEAKNMPNKKGKEKATKSVKGRAKKTLKLIRKTKLKRK